MASESSLLKGARSDGERHAMQDVALAVIGMHVLDQDERNASIGYGGKRVHVLR